jgi:hypothetical protein
MDRLVQKADKEIERLRNIDKVNAERLRQIAWDKRLPQTFKGSRGYKKINPQDYEFSDLYSRGLPAPQDDPINNGAQQAPLNDLLINFLASSGNIITDEEIDAMVQKASEENAPYEVGAPYVGQDVRSAGPFANEEFRGVQRIARELRRPTDTIETDASVLAAARLLVANGGKDRLYEDLLDGSLPPSATSQAAVFLALAEDARNRQDPRRYAVEWPSLPWQTIS